MKSTNIEVGAVMALTGLGRNQVYRLAKKGCIPATVIGRRFVMTEGQLDQLKREGVKPEPITTDHQQPTFIKRRAS